MRYKADRITWSVLLCYLVATGLTRADSFYHLATPDKTCHVAGLEGATVDLVCQYFDKGRKAQTCHMKSIHWQKVGAKSVTNVTDDQKFGVWDAMPGWGMQDDEHITLLRIRHLVAEDIGTYRCEIQCVDDDGIPHKAYHYTDVCLQQPNSAYAICASPAPSGYCGVASFWNGVCDLGCETEKYLFDGFECIDQLGSCGKPYDGMCASYFSNGICDSNCNTAECAWDGGDCITTPLKFADDTLVLFLSGTGWRQISEGAVDLKEIGRSLSQLLRTIVRVLPDNWNGEHMQTDARGSSESFSDNLRNSDFPSNQNGVRAMRLFLKIDNTQCKKSCFRRAERAAQFVTMALQNDWDPGIPISAVGVLSKVGNRCTLENNSMLNIDLDALDQGSNLGYRGLGMYGLQSWILIAAISGGCCLLVLIFSLTLVACRVQKSSTTSRHSSPQKLRPHYDSARIMVDKRGPPGTDV